MTDLLKPAQEWCDIHHVKVLDPDGWRNEMKLPWDTPITEEDFWRRFGVSTVILGGHRER